MNGKVYLFGAFLGLQTNGQKSYGNFILGFKAMPSYEEIKQELKMRNDDVNDLVIISMQFITSEQFYALKGEKPDNPQSELLDKKIDDSSLSIRTKNICKANGLNTLRDICRIAKTDWLKFRNGGIKSMSEIDDFLKENGLTWRMKV